MPTKRRRRAAQVLAIRRRPAAGKRLALLVAVALVALLLGFWLGRRWAPRSERPAPYPRAGGARVALVIDDLGRSLDDVTALAALPVPVSFGVLPFETRTAAVVAELRRRRAEILMHLPMEPRRGQNPGLGALTADMDAATLAAATRRALAAVPGAVGVNHHMGSALASDRAAMRPVLETVRRGGLFYLDSRTSADSVGYLLARELGVPAAERQVFLDPDPGPEAVRRQFARLLEEARTRGSAIAIGHPHPATLDVLARELPRALAAGYEFVPVSRLVH